MKEIKFTNLKVKNFRNINELEVDFGNKQTMFKGQNKLGKTNILHGILWCLFGKNVYNEKQFTISPIIDGVEDNSINTNVKLVINGEYVISRTYYNRTTKLEVGFVDSDGEENLVAMTQTQYLKDLEEKYVDEETFKSLSNIEYITNIHWKDLKELIFELIGDIKDEEVMLRDDFSLIEELVKNFGIDKTVEQLTKTDKELNEEIKNLETEYQTTLNMKEKYVMSEDNTDELLARKKVIEMELSNNEEISEKSKELIAKRQQLEINIEDSKRNIKMFSNDISFAESNIAEYKQLYDSSSNSVDDLREEDKNKKLREIESAKQDILTNEKLIEEQKLIVEQLKTKGNELKAKEVKVENSSCPTCKQTLPEEMINETLSLAKKQREFELLAIKDDYEQKKLLLSNLESDLVANKKYLNELEKDLKEIDTKEYVVEESDRQKQLRIARETKELEVVNKKKSLEENQKGLLQFENELSKLELPEITKVDNTSLVEELDNINSKLATSTTLRELEKDLENCKLTLESRKDNKIKNKEKMQQCIKFNNLKAELLKQKVSDYFTYVNFRTKDYTVDGLEVETFKITNANNVEFKECSQGEKLLLGIELLVVIQEFKGIRVPLILDEMTVLTTDVETTTQIIGTYADKTKPEIEIEVK